MNSNIRCQTHCRRLRPMVKLKSKMALAEIIYKQKRPVKRAFQLFSYFNFFKVLGRFKLEYLIGVNSKVGNGFTINQHL